MLRRNVLCAALVTLSLTAPQETQAQIGTLCGTEVYEESTQQRPPADWCYNVTQFHYVRSVSSNNAAWNDFQVTIAGYFSGSVFNSFSSLGLLQFNVAPYPFLGSTDAFLSPDESQPYTKGYSAMSVDAPVSITSSIRDVPFGDWWTPRPELFELQWQAFRGSARVLGECGAGYEASGRCTPPGTNWVSVPEPSTYLLMLTGVMGLGFIAWRRRETLA